MQAVLWKCIIVVLEAASRRHQYCFCATMSSAPVHFQVQPWHARFRLPHQEFIV